MSSASPPDLPAHKRVLRAAGAAEWWGWYLVAILAALLVPCLIVVLGAVAKLLEDGGVSELWLPLGRFLYFPVPAFLLDEPPVRQLIWLVACGVAVALLQSLTLWLFYRGLHRRSRLIVKQLHEQVLATSIRVAEAEGITAQRNRTGRLIDHDLPKVQQGLVARWRAIPRSLVLTILCTALAVAVDVWLTLLALISGLIVWLLYRWLAAGAKLRFARYDLTTIRQRLVESVQTVPVVSRVRGDDAPVDESGGPLAQLLEATQVRDQARARLVPIVTAVAILFVALLLIALGANMLVEDSPLNLPAALVLTFALIGAVVGATRIIRSLSGVQEFHEACEAVYHFVDRGNGGTNSQRVGLSDQQHSVELANVTMLDGLGRTLLDRLSLRLEPGTVVALMGTESVALGALVELLMGFGTPQAGTVKIGGVLVGELHQAWLSKHVLWIGQNGPIWSGTISDNFRFADTMPDTGAVSDAARRVGVYDRLQSLPDGFSTLISADDQRIDEATRYGIATARAWIRRPTVIIVQEPPTQPSTLADDPAIDALCELASEGAMVILLPQRLQTLRRSDRVILLNGGSLAGEGKHEKLLAESDLYRHLNYVLFNPYRNNVLKRNIVS